MNGSFGGRHSIQLSYGERMGLRWGNEPTIWSDNQNCFCFRISLSINIVVQAIVAMPVEI